TTGPTAGSELLNWLESTMRSAIVMRYASAVIDQLLAGWLQGDAEAQIDGGLFLEGRYAERLGHPALVVAREDAIGDQVAERVDHELVAHVVEPGLGQRWSAEPGARGRAQSQGGDDLEPAGHLAVQGAAEVAVVFEPPADVEQHALAHLALEPAVHAEAGARPVHLVGRLEAWEHLGAGLLRRSVRHGVEVGAGRGPAVAQLPGGFLARVDAVLLTA